MTCITQDNKIDNKTLNYNNLKMQQWFSDIYKILIKQCNFLERKYVGLTFCKLAPIVSTAFVDL